MAMQFGLGVLKLPPAIFWAMTIPEFKAALDGYIRMLGGDDTPISRNDLFALQNQFPDL